MTTQTLPSRTELREIAIASLVDSMRRDRAGLDVVGHYREQVEPAIDAAVAAGWGAHDIRGDADRQYGQWLIDNAGQD